MARKKSILELPEPPPIAFPKEYAVLVMEREADVPVFARRLDLNPILRRSRSIRTSSPTAGVHTGSFPLKRSRCCGGGASEFAALKRVFLNGRPFVYRSRANLLSCRARRSDA